MPHETQPDQIASDAQTTLDEIRHLQADRAHRDARRMFFVEGVRNVVHAIESGFPIVASTWVGIFAPARTDAAILQKLNLAVNDVLRESSTQSQLAALQTEFRIGDRADAADYFRRDVAQWKTMITRIGLMPQ